MIRMENSPEFEAEMKARAAKRDRKERDAKTAIAKARKAGHGATWTPMDKCPIAAIELFDGIRTLILVSDGKSVTVASVHRRFGTPVFYKKHPDLVMHDGMMRMVGGEVDPRPDLPKWWWKYELTDELESERQYYDSSTKPEVDFVPTHWMWLPKPPQL